MPSQSLALHTNHCNHPIGSFAGHYLGKDVYFFKAPDGTEWQYCLRSSSDGGDYASGAVKHLFHQVNYDGLLSHPKLLAQSANERVGLISMFFAHLGITTETL